MSRVRTSRIPATPSTGFAVRPGVMGEALSLQATPELAVARLRPTVLEHEVRRHLHADMHLIVLLGGRYVSDAVGMPEVCAEPVVILNPPGTEHRDRFRSRHGLFLTLTMPAQAYARLADGVPFDERPRRLPAAAVSRAVRLLPELDGWEATSPLAVESLFTELLTMAPQASVPVPAAALQRVMDRLEAEGAPLPTLDELAAIAGLHPVYLARAFRRHVGVAPATFLRRRRLHRALSLIAARRPLAEAATALGFVDQSHLHRNFVAEFGLTPGAFRRLALGRAEVSRIQDGYLGAC